GTSYDDGVGQMEGGTAAMTGVYTNRPTQEFPPWLSYALVPVSPPDRGKTSIRVASNWSSVWRPITWPVVSTKPSTASTCRLSATPMAAAAPRPIPDYSSQRPDACSRME